MAKRILIHSGIADLEIAVVDDGVLERYWSESALGGDGDEESDRADSSRVGDIVLARVKRVVPAINAAFADIGDARDGFLSVRDARRNGAGERAEGMKIGDILHEGDAVLVQVLRDAMDDKGARLSANPSLPGRYLVYAPAGDRVTVSRRIEDEAERTRLAELVRGIGPEGGYVVRTAATSASEAELREDVGSLRRLWDDIVAARDEAEPPAILHHEIGPIERALRDNVRADVECILVDDREALELARVYATRAMPEFLDRIVPYKGSEGLFAEHDIDDDIDALSSREVGLRSGGRIAIDHTEALTAIDVNSGSHTREADLAATALKVDLEAADAIPRQIVLRGIGGIVVVDFIPLPDDDKLEEVIETLRRNLKRAGLSAEIARAAGLSLVVMTLKGARANLHRRSSEVCEVCDGRGHRPTAERIAVAALRQVERAATAAPGKAIAMRVSREVAAWLEANAEYLRTEFARRGISSLRVFPENGRARESFSVETEGLEAAK